jgi:hypothetical protein
MKYKMKRFPIDKILDLKDESKDKKLQAVKNQIAQWSDYVSFKFCFIIDNDPSKKENIVDWEVSIDTEDFLDSIKELADLHYNDILKNNDNEEEEKIPTESKTLHSMKAMVRDNVKKQEVDGWFEIMRFGKYSDVKMLFPYIGKEPLDF